MPPSALILEDEYLIASDVATDLKNAGFQVMLVPTEKAAQSWLSNNRPDVAIIDIGLPDGTGIGTANRLKDLGVPFIVHSGYDAALHPPILREAPYVVKPAPTEKLVSMVLDLLPG